MSDILIRGMEMPKSCLDCPIMVNRYDTNACALQSQEANEAFERWEDMRRNCPIVPLQEGHGRLGDLDEMMEYIKNHEYELKSRMGCVGNGMFTYQIKEYANNHTIVPAEGGTDNG